MNVEALNREMKLYGDLLVREYRKKLKEDKTFASGDLSKSLVFDLEQLNNSIALVISGYEYGRAVDTGTDSKNYNKQPPVSNPRKGEPMSALERWLQTKGRIRDSKGRYKAKTLKNINRAAFGLAKYIKQNGTIQRFGGNARGSNFLTLVFDRLAGKMGEDLALAFGADLQIELEKILYTKK